MLSQRRKDRQEEPSKHKLQVFRRPLCALGVLARGEIRVCHTSNMKMEPPPLPRPQGRGANLSEDAGTPRAPAATHDANGPLSPRPGKRDDPPRYPGLQAQGDSRHGDHAALAFRALFSSLVVPANAGVGHFQKKCGKPPDYSGVLSPTISSSPSTSWTPMNYMTWAPTPRRRST